MSKKTFTPGVIAAAALLLAAAAAVPAYAATTVLDFEGATSYASIADFYNGGSDGAGALGSSNFGVSFTGAAQALVNDELGPYFSNAPTPGTVMFATDSSAVMNVAGGFTHELSFFYSASSSALDVVTIYSGLNGTGDVLGAVSLSANAQLGGCSDTGFCNWQRIALSFAGTGQSISFGGNAGGVAFDNVAIDTVTAAVPEPQTAAMLAFGLAGLMVVARRQRRS